MEEICLVDSGGPGLGSVRQSLWPQVSIKASAFLQMFVVVIDRERKLA
jgi:hypothetical protein